MNSPSTAGITLATVILLVGITTCIWQLRARRILMSRNFVPSDEFTYLYNRYRRRLFTGTLLIVVGLMIGTAYLSGMETRADALGEPKNGPIPLEVDKPKMTQDDKDFLRLWGSYWIVVVLLVFVVLGCAFTDAWSTRRYALKQYYMLREDHQTKLRRDLAVYKQQMQSSRAGRITKHRPSDPKDDTPLDD